MKIINIKCMCVCVRVRVHTLSGRKGRLVAELLLDPGHHLLDILWARATYSLFTIRPTIFKSWWESFTER